MYATPARNIIPMRENERRRRCPGGKEEKRLPIGRGTRRRGGRRSSVMVYSREHNSLAHRSMVGNYCKFIRAARFHPPPSGSPSPRCFYPTFSIFHPRPPLAMLGRSHRDPTPPLSAAAVAPAGPKTPSREAEIATFRAKRRNYLTL